MPYILGLDTGGTYTDGVLVDIHTEQIVAKAKAFTTKHNLRIGMEACIDALKITDYSAIKMVALSTTLATNAVVEHRGGKTGLILIGKKGCEGIPTEYVEVIDGEMDIKGNVLIPVSERQAAEAVRRLMPDVDAIAISAYASVRNPQHERRVKKIVEQLSELPVFCAHELTGALGYAERTATAVLNASLIGIVTDFVAATKESLRNRNIQAELMIVKSDGSLMREQVALNRPIDTILSGPAASVIGAQRLTGISNALVLDMGGTTVDIADITKGKVRVSNECASVAGWKTKVHAVEISTHGVGGDSLITVCDEIHIGPQKAEPISRVSCYYNNIRQEIEDIRKATEFSHKEKETLSRCYCLIKETHLYNGDSVHDKIVDLLRIKPHSMAFLKKQAGREISNTIQIMLQNKEINVIDLTPTDILHILNRYNEWDRQVAVIRGEIVAAANHLTLNGFALKAEQAVYKKIYTACIQAIADFERHHADLKNDRAAKYLIDKLFNDGDTGFLKAGCRLRKPLVAVGAPVKAWLSFLSQKMNTQVIFPEYADVANAIGSAFGEVKTYAEALLRKDPDREEYTLHLPTEKRIFHSRKAAMLEAEKILIENVRTQSRAAGCSEADVTVDRKEFYMNSFGGAEKKYVETRIRACAKGRPDSWNV